MVSRFVRLFGTHLDPAVAARLAMWAATEMRTHVERVMERWHAQIKLLTNQRSRLREREQPLAAIANPTVEDEESLGRVLAELRYVAWKINEARREPTLNALESLGLTPNYTLFDDTVTLQVSLWQPNDDHDPAASGSARFSATQAEYTRPAAVAIRELAPGHYFYVDAHRVRIDAVDNGTENEPAHAPWRLCPSCSWATTDASAKHAACPRCGSAGVADQGAVLTVLPMRVVSSTERELTARVGDDSDERDRVFHEVLTTVDVAPEDITAAWLHTGVVFGIESARAATIRHLNLGLHASQAAQARHLRIAGDDLQAALFTVCRHCGGVRGVRGQFNEPDDPNHHRGWCKVRSGARAPQWDTLALAHELVTEAVRVLLPVAEFEAAERVTSFKAALMLGLRDSFGGDPSHLRVIRSEFPAPGGSSDARNRFVVIHDTVPGGTGYLPRLADPERLRGILGRAVELISTCECQTRGKAGCHKCLYTAVARHEIPLVSRTVALGILDEILTDWGLREPESGTITGINLAPVVQSELERMFKALLHRWAESGAVRLTSRPDPDDSRLTRFDLRFQDGPHWELREQINLAAHHTRPDFYATRVDTPGTAPVAIYLDGWEFHGAVPDQIDHDAQRRASVRTGGTVVWTLTWADVKAALLAANQHSTVGPATPVGNAIRSAARTGAKQLHGSDHPAFGAVTQGAFSQLLTHLRHPDPLTWQRLATALALAPGPSGTHVPVADRQATMDRLACGGQPDPSPTPTGIDTISWGTVGGLTVVTVLDKNPAVPTVTSVASLETAGEADRGRWEDWTHLGNVLQFLGGAAILTTTRTWTPEGEAPRTEPTPATAPTAERQGGPIGDVLDDCYDDTARALAETALAAGYSDLVVGYEPGDAEGTVLEVAWPAQNVGILPTGAAQPSALDTWTVRTPDQWDPADLLAALSEGAQP